MPLPVDVNFTVLPAMRRIVGTGVRFTVPLTDYDPVGKLIEIVFVRPDDSELELLVSSTGDYITAFPASGDVPAYVDFSIPHSVLAAIAVAGKLTQYGISFRDDAETDPSFSILGDLTWAGKAGDPHD